MIELILGGAFTAGVTALLVAMHIVGPKPRLSRRWAVKATVRVADGSEALDGLVRACVDRWRKLGAPLEPLVELGGIPQARIGEIAIVGFDELTNDHGGECEVWRSTTDETRLVRAEVRVPDDCTELILMHELGHALGFGHVSKNGHVLAPNTERLGDSTAGIKRAFKKATT